MSAPVTPAARGTFNLGVVDATYTAGDIGELAANLAVIRSLGEPVACDIETFGLGTDARRIKCVSFANRTMACVLDPRDGDQAELIEHMINKTGMLVFHNSTFDVPSLALNDLIDRDHCDKITDTLIYARLAWPDMLMKKDLDSLGARLLGMQIGEKIQAIFRRLGMTKADGFKRLDISSPAYLMGAATDAVVTARILPMVRQAAFRTLTSGHPFSTFGVTGDEAWRLVDREQVINRMMLRRAVRGLRVDFDYLEKYRDATQADRFAAEAELVSADVKPGNGNSLMKKLDTLGAIPDGYPRTAKTRAPSATADNLERLSHPLAKLYVKAKQIAKVEDDYLAKVAALAIDGRIYPVTNLLKATTGRASMGDPPLHQFPEAARGIILADEGDSLTSIDWSQIEPVTIANIAGDVKVLAGYEQGTSDLYTDVGRLAQVERKVAKVVLLAQLYGEGLGTLAADLGIDYEEAEEIKSFIFSTMPRTKNLMWKLREIGGQFRKVFTLSGRILDVPMGRGFDGGPPSVATHKAINYFVQGSAYDVLAETLIEVEAAGLGDALYLTMHDELVVSSSAAHDVDLIMRRPPERLVYLAKRTPTLRTDTALLGERWAAA